MIDVIVEKRIYDGEGADWYVMFGVQLPFAPYCGLVLEKYARAIEIRSVVWLCEDSCFSATVAPLVVHVDTVVVKATDLLEDEYWEVAVPRTDLAAGRKQVLDKLRSQQCS